MSPEIGVEFSITHSILEENYLLEVLRCVSTFDGGRWRPDRYNNSEPINKRFSVDNLDEVVKLWIAGRIGIMLKRLTAPKYVFDCSGEHRNLTVKHQSGLLLDEPSLKSPLGVQALLDFVTCLYGVLRPAYAHAEHWQDFLSKNQQVQKQGAATIETWVGRRLEISLPGLYWANWFGPAYVRFLGPERFETLTCYRKERLTDGGYFVMTAPTPFSYDAPEVQGAERAIIQHLGEDAFFDINRPDRRLRSPWTHSPVEVAGAER